jgi:hypothetical protein
VEVLEDRLAPAIFTVTNSNDCGFGSLRQAILNSNAGCGCTPNMIRFAIPGPGLHTINLQSALPEVTRPVVIDGYTQPGSSPNTAAVGDNAVLTIELSGAGAGACTNGLTIDTVNSTVRGLVIDRFSGDGIALVSCVTVAAHDVIAGNFIGTNAAGTAALPNNTDALSRDTAAAAGVALLEGAHDNTVGGPSPADRNVISGNFGEGVLIYKRIDPKHNFDTRNNTVQNNYIGTNAAGTAPLGNHRSGIFVPFAGGNRIVGNVVSGNTGFAGIALGGVQSAGGPSTRLGALTSTAGDGSGNVVAGNRIGTNAAGAAAVANRGFGISVDGGSGMTIGGTSGGQGNVISGNGSDGIYFFHHARDVKVQGNSIGTSAAGTAALGNSGDGIAITDGSHAILVGGTTAGAGNTIAFNGRNGVLVDAATGNAIRRNSIFSHPAGLGIRLNNNGNNNQPAPALTSAFSDGLTVTVSGTFRGTPNTTFTLEFFSNTALDAPGVGEGQTFLRCLPVTTNAVGIATFTFSTADVWGRYITATATDPHCSTSEFSPAVAEVFTTTTTVTAAVNPSLFGQPVIITVTVKPPPGTGTPTGVVTFLADNGLSIGTATLSTTGGLTTATFTIGILAPGSYLITAAYSGDGDFDQSLGTIQLTILPNNNLPYPLPKPPPPPPPGPLPGDPPKHGGGDAPTGLSSGSSVSASRIAQASGGSGGALPGRPLVPNPGEEMVLAVLQQVASALASVESTLLSMRPWRGALAVRLGSSLLEADDRVALVEYIERGHSPAGRARGGPQLPGQAGPREPGPVAVTGEDAPRVPAPAGEQAGVCPLALATVAAETPLGPAPAGTEDPPPPAGDPRGGFLRRAAVAAATAAACTGALLTWRWRRGRRTRLAPPGPGAIPPESPVVAE